MTEIQIPYLPSAQFFKILCRLGVNEPDVLGDSDSDPQIRTIGGTVSISAMVPRFRYTEADGRKRVVYTKNETYNIDTSTGELVDADGNLGVNLLNTNSPQMDPQGWTYKATIRPNGGDPFDAFIPSNPEGGVYDLGDGLVFTPSTGITSLETRVKALEDAGGSGPGAPENFDESVQDIVGAMVAGAGGTYDDAAGTIVLPSGGGGAVSSVAGRTGIVVMSSADLTDAASLATDAELSSGLAAKADAVHEHTSANIADWAEAVQDTVAAMLVSGANVTLAYDDDAGKVTVTAVGGDAEVMRDTIGAALVGVGGVSVAINDEADTITLSLSGVTSVQISDSTAIGRSLLTAADAAAARAAIGAGTSDLELATTEETLDGSDTTKAVTPAGLKAVADTKAPALGADDNYVTDAEKTKLADLSGTNTGDQDLSGYVQTTNAPELIRDTIGSTLVAGSNVTITPDDANDTITIAASGGGGGASVPMQGGPISGSWLMPPGSYTGNSSTELNGHTCVTPYPVERAVTINKLATRVSSTAAGATVVLALYNSTAAGLPGDRIAMTGTLDASVATSITGDITPVALTPGLYWMAVYGVSGATFVGENHQTSSLRVSTSYYHAGPDPWQYNQLQMGYSVSGAPPATWPATPARSSRGTAYAFVVAQ